ncbi:unnamed protein product, partial [marine sediment metagenome]
MDKKEFLNIINQAAIVFEVELAEERIAAYFAIFKEYSTEAFSDAMNQVVRVCKFFPKPAEILDFMGGKGK